MRYVHKNQESDAYKLLEETKQSMRTAGINLTYDNFVEKRQLNELLRTEQKHICCYCQQTITHHNLPTSGGSHNEHFIPENGPHGSLEHQLDYYNLYACCNHSKDYEERLKYCGWSKHDKLIEIDLLQMRNCATLFKYNLNGEILPQCPYASFEECKTHKESLTKQQYLLLKAIDVLNLNVDYLKRLRRDIWSDTVIYIKGKTNRQLQNKIQLLSQPTSGKYIPMVDLVLYILKQSIRSNRATDL